MEKEESGGIRVYLSDKPDAIVQEFDNEEQMMRALMGNEAYERMMQQVQEDEDAMQACDVCKGYGTGLCRDCDRLPF